MNKIISLALVTAVFIVSGCSTGGDEPDPQPVTPNNNTTNNTTEKLELDTTSATPTFSSDGGTTQLTITTTSAWTADASDSRASSWCTISPTSGAAGTIKLTITTQPNTTYDERNATITFKSGDLSKNFTITQKQKDAILLSSDKVEVSYEGGTFSVYVQTNVSYEVKTSGDWISQVISRGFTNQKLVFNVKQNTSESERTGTVTITNGSISETVKVTQAGAPSKAGTGDIDDMPIHDW
jgi:hypothetical protein